jgi:DNA recombination protein RmuC
MTILPAFLTAIQNDSTLWADAYHQKILLVGPTTLLYVIRIVHVLWESEIQARNVEEVMQRGSSLYEKFVGFINDLEDLGRSINGANLSYEAAKRKLSEGPDNLVKQVEKLRQLGVKRKLKRGSKQRVTKSIPIELLSAAGVFDSESAEGEAASSENSELSGELEGDSEDIV